MPKRSHEYKKGCHSQMLVEANSTFLLHTQQQYGNSQDRRPGNVQRHRLPQQVVPKYVTPTNVLIISSSKITNSSSPESLFFIIFNPLYWNFGARLEYYTGIPSMLALGNKKLAVWAFAASVFTLGLFRDEIYRSALQEQATSPYLQHPLIKLFSVILFGVGSTFVAGSMYQLGVVGTYLGDHFGFLFDERLVSFPFNVVDNPMYDGSFMCFLATGLFYAKPAGLFASALVYAMYQVVLLIEEPFTAKIYEKRDIETQKKSL